MERTIAQISQDWARRAYRNLYAIHRTAQREGLPITVAKVKGGSEAVSVVIRGKGKREVFMVAISPFGLESTRAQFAKWGRESKAPERTALQVALDTHRRWKWLRGKFSIAVQAYAELEREHDALISYVAARESGRE